VCRIHEIAKRRSSVEPYSTNSRNRNSTQASLVGQQVRSHPSMSSGVQPTLYGADYCGTTYKTPPKLLSFNPCSPHAGEVVPQSSPVTSKSQNNDMPDKFSSSNSPRPASSNQAISFGLLGRDGAQLNHVNGSTISAESRLSREKLCPSQGFTSKGESYLSETTQQPQYATNLRDAGYVPTASWPHNKQPEHTNEPRPPYDASFDTEHLQLLGAQDMAHQTSFSATDLAANPSDMTVSNLWRPYIAPAAPESELIPKSPPAIPSGSSVQYSTFSLNTSAPQQTLPTLMSTHSETSEPPGSS
jgi:hypothetical protein